VLGRLGPETASQAFTWGFHAQTLQTLVSSSMCNGRARKEHNLLTDNKTGQQEKLITYCYSSKALRVELRGNLVLGNTRELDRELCIGLSTLYTRGIWSMLSTFSLP